MPVQIQGEMGIRSRKTCFATGENPLCSCPLCVSLLWVLSVFWDASVAMCLHMQLLSIQFKLTHQQKGCTLPSICDGALWVILLPLTLKTLWLIPHSPSSPSELCDWPWGKIFLCCVYEDIKHHWSVYKGNRKKGWTGVVKKKQNKKLTPAMSVLTYIWVSMVPPANWSPDIPTVTCLSHLCVPAPFVCTGWWTSSGRWSISGF